MTRIAPAQNSFGTGEISPSLYGRQDLAQYKNALKTCLNAVITPRGAWEKRPGTLAIGRTKNDGPVRLIPFTPTLGQSIMIEAGDKYFRFYKDYKFTGEEIATPYSFKQVEKLGFTQSIDVMWFCHNDYPPMVLKHYKTGFKLEPFKLLDGPYEDVNSDDNLKIRLYTGYTLSSKSGIEYFDLKGKDMPLKLKFGDVIEIYDERTGVIQDVKITVAGHAKETGSGPVCYTDWNKNYVLGPTQNFKINGQIIPKRLLKIHAQIHDRGDTGVLVSSKPVFTRADAGKIFRIENKKDNPHKWYTVYIENYTDPKHVEVSWVGKGLSVPKGDIEETNNWRFGSFGGASYPRVVAFHEDRLVFANTKSKPNGIWFSKTASYESFAPSLKDGTVLANSSIALALNARELSEIYWLVSENSLLAGTPSAVWVIKPSDYSEALTSKNASARGVTQASSADSPPARVENTTIYIHRSLTQLRGFFKSETGYDAPDLSELSDHLLAQGLKQIVWQEAPYSIIWGVRNDGKLIGLTSLRRTNMQAWHQHDLGGFVENIQTLSGPSSVQRKGGQDDLYLIINRNGQRVIEVMAPYWQEGRDLSHAYFVDSGKIYQGAPTSTLTMPSHLNNHHVSVVADGKLQTVRVVNNAITLAHRASRITAGYPYVAQGELVDLEAGARNGTAQGKARHIYRVVFRLFQSMPFDYGARHPVYGPKTYACDFRGRLKNGHFYQEGKDGLYTGDAQVQTRTGFVRNINFLWQQKSPYPLVITAIYPRLGESDG